MKLLVLAEKYGYTCHWCKRKFPLDDLTRDHIYPKGHPKRGVSRKQGSMVLACIVCNQERGNLPYEVFKNRKVKKEKEISPHYTLEEIIKPSRLK